MKITREADQRRWKLIRSYIGWEDYFAFALILLGAAGFIEGPLPFIPHLTDFYLGIRSELVGIGITVLIIDNVNEMYRRRAEKERLILQMGSPDNTFAIEAVRQLGTRDWLYDGSLRRAKLIGANLGGADLSKANLTGAFLWGANLTGAYLVGANLGAADLREADLRRANLIWALLVGADLSKAALLEADLSKANLTGAFLVKADLRGADMYKADLRGAYLVGADLRGANLTEADLRGADLTDAGLTFASLRGGIILDMDDLTLAGLRGADLREANLHGAKYDNLTQWPDGFDPEKAGAVLER